MQKNYKKNINTYTINMKNVFLYFSAFVPMYFLGLVKFSVGTLSGTINLSLLTILTMIFFTALIVMGVIGLIWNMKTNKGKTSKITVESFTNITDQHFLSYFSLFVLYVLGFQLTKPSMLTVSFFIVLFIGIVYVNNKMFYINPLLNILGYNFYEITYTLNGKTQTTKVYFKGELKQKKYTAHFQNKNFSFLEN
jgi:hypothetical protein